MAMVTLTCPHCGFSKDLDKTCLPPIGTKVTCPKCRGFFTYAPSQAEAPLVPSCDSPVDPPPAAFRTTQTQIANVKKRKSIGLPSIKRPVRLVVVAVVISVIFGGFYRLSFSIQNSRLEADSLTLLDAMASAEQNERDSILDQSESLLLAARFDELDKIADQYRSTKEAFIDGEWKLNVFYDGVSYYLRQAPEDNWVSRLDRLRQWVNAKPNSITARVALAECLAGYAFHGRGGAYANEVTDDQWQCFNDRMKEASEILEQAKDLQQKCPGWWAAYQRVALGGGWDRTQYEQFLDSAIASEPTFNVFYFRMAWHLLPWWFGEEGDWERFAESMANRIGGQDGDILYARIIWFMHRRGPKNVVNKNPEIKWKRINNGIQLLKRLNANVKT